MLIGSHNSITYSSPKKWWMRPFLFIARCQSKTIEEQFEKYDIRLFDLRIKIKNGQAIFAHGSMDYKQPIEPILNYLNNKASNCEEVYVRILSENKPEEYENEFISWCQDAEQKYPNLRFFGGRNKYTWKQIYKFKSPEPTYLDKYSSYNKEKGKITGTYLDDWFPWIYAKFHNKKNIKVGTDRDYLLIDFVNIR